jgi:hypothetical protein
MKKNQTVISETKAIMSKMKKYWTKSLGNQILQISEYEDKK